MDLNLYQSPDTIIEKVYQENSEYPVFVNLYTTDNGYEKYAEKLIESLDEFKLSYYIEGHLTRGKKWDEITKYKPYILLKALDRYPKRPIVWIDADATIEKMPVLFPKIKKDFAVHYFGGRSLGSGLVYFANTKVSRDILQDWEIENKKSVKVWDQKHLENVIRRKYKSVEERLPKEYCCIFDKPGYKNLDRVIAQWQASRKLKNRSGQIKLKTNEWFALKCVWKINGSEITCVRDTWVKKSLKHSKTLDNSMKRAVKKGTIMNLSNGNASNVPSYYIIEL